MPTVIIDGIEYVPKADIPELTDASLTACLRELTAIQYFAGERHKHRSWAWDAMNAIAPELAKMDPEVAFAYIRKDDPD